MLRRLFAITALLAIAARSEVTIESVPGQSTVQAEFEAATDFSGLTWVSGDDYFTVSNQTNGIFTVKIRVTPGTGRISDLRFGPSIPITTDYSDLEGIAWQPEKERVYFSSESANGIVGFSRDGLTTFPVKVPAVFKMARNNKSLESLTYGAKTFWTANEDTLKCDGEMSSVRAGGLVRLQKFDANFRPLAQYAYRTETSLFRVHDSGTGVPDMCALPDGEVLVLERVLGLGLSAKIYLLDFTGATDTSKLEHLNLDKPQPVRKKLLFEHATGLHNFEGIALGPDLGDGWHSLILVADSDGGITHFFMPLRIKWTK